MTLHRRWGDVIFTSYAHKYNVDSTSMQRHDVASTLRRRYIYVMCPLGCFPSCYQSFTLRQQEFAMNIAFSLWYIVKIGVIVVYNAWQYVMSLTFSYLLTFTTLWANSAGEKLMIFVFYIIFLRKQDLVFAILHNKKWTTVIIIAMNISYLRLRNWSGCYDSVDSKAPKSTAATTPNDKVLHCTLCFTQHYENTPIQIYWKFYNQNRRIFR